MKLIACENCGIVYDTESDGFKSYAAGATLAAEENELAIQVYGSDNLEQAWNKAEDRYYVYLRCKGCGKLGINYGEKP